MKHQLAYDRARPGARARGYDAQHEAWRRAVLDRDDYRCVAIEITGERCGESEHLHADHINPNGPRYDVANGQTLCHSHHSAKTAARDGGFGNRRR